MTDTYSLDLKGSCKHVGLGRDKLLRAINAGALPALRSTTKPDANGDPEPAGKYLIRVADLEAWVDGLPAA